MNIYSVSYILSFINYIKFFVLNNLLKLNCFNFGIDINFFSFMET